MLLPQVYFLIWTPKLLLTGCGGGAIRRHRRGGWLRHWNRHICQQKIQLSNTHTDTLRHKHTQMHKYTHNNIEISVNLHRLAFKHTQTYIKYRFIPTQNTHAHTDRHFKGRGRKQSLILVTGPVVGSKLISVVFNLDAETVANRVW